MRAKALKRIARLPRSIKIKSTSRGGRFYVLILHATMCLKNAEWFHPTPLGVTAPAPVEFSRRNGVLSNSSPVNTDVRRCVNDEATCKGNTLRTTSPTYFPFLSLSVSLFLPPSLSPPLAIPQRIRSTLVSTPKWCTMQVIRFPYIPDRSS